MRKLLDDKLGRINLNGSNVELLDSRLTLGGQQYSNDLLSVALPALSTATLYYVYAKLDTGAAVLEISTDVPSVYRAGIESKTQLVGAFYSNGLSSVGFGSFVNIEGRPETEIISMVPTGDWITNTTYTGIYRREGDTMIAEITISLSGTPNSSPFRVDVPLGLTLETTKLSDNSLRNRTLGTCNIRDNSTGNDIFGPVGYSSATQIRPFSNNDATDGVISSAVTEAAPFTFTTDDKIVMRFEAPISEWSNTPLKDL